MELKDFGRIEEISKHLKSKAEEYHSGLCLDCYCMGINDFLEMIRKN